MPLSPPPTTTTLSAASEFPLLISIPPPYLPGHGKFVDIRWFICMHRINIKIQLSSQSRERKMRGFRPWLAAAALSALCVPQAGAEEHTIVALQSLTGAAAFVGIPITEGMKQAVRESNAAGELGEGRRINLVIADDATDRTQATTLVTRYGRDPSVLAILGPTSGAVAQLGAQVGNELKVPVLTTTNNPKILEYGPWSYIMTQTPADSITHLADYAAQKLKLKNCALIGIQNIEVYVQLLQEFEQGITAQGVAIGAREMVQSTDTDFSSISTKIAFSDVDCVFIASYAAQGAGIATQLRQAGLDPKVTVMGLNIFSSPEFVNIAGAAAEGVHFYGEWIPGGFDASSRAFAQRFEAETGAAPDSWAAVGYSIMRVLIEALAKAGPEPTRDDLREALDATKDVPVRIGFGRYSLLDDRRPIYGTYVLKIENGSYVAVTD
ncbi:hypothetical protein DTW92_03610 [Paracoccus pantotrophus]|nr:hypothetical protein DTW92_03610 [Paracoccus pantotrophus]WGR66130.1 hypothetical protein E3U24_12435 [Paracoccus pantotrophus]